MRLTTLAFLILSAVCGCDDKEEEARYAVQELRCIWSHRYNHCFCVSSLGYRGYMSWVPPELCRAK